MTDLPTVLYLQAAVLDKGVVVGQFEPIAGDGDEFAFLLEKGSELTAPVTAASPLVSSTMRSCSM